MSSIKDALKEIDEAVAENNGSVIGQYLNDGRPPVRAAANKAFLKMQANPAEDNTPIPEEWKKETSEAKKEENKAPVMPGEEKKSPIRNNEWVKMTVEQAAKFELSGKLVGFDPANELGLLKK